MADSDLMVTITVDAGGAQKGADDARTAIAGIAPQVAALGKSFAGLGASLKGALEGLGQVGAALAGVGKSSGFSALAAQAQQGEDKLTEIAARGAEQRARDAQKTAAAQLAATRAQIAERIAAVQAEAEAGTISAREESAQIAALRQQDAQAAQDAAAREHAIQEAALEQKLALYQADTEQYRNAQDAIANYALQYSAQVTRLQADALRQQDEARKADLARFKQEWDGAIDPLVTSFNNGLLQMAEGSKSFAQAIRSIGQQILSDFVTKVIDPMVEHWLYKELGQTLATRLGVTQRLGAEQQGAAQSAAISAEAGIRDITTSAAQAAGGAYKAMAGIPVVGPALGAAAAATVFAAVLAFRGMISSAAGGFDIPAGVNPLTQLHAREMVLPARLANPLRAMMDDYVGGHGAGFQGPAGAGGDTHVHNWSVSAMDGPSLERFLRTNGDRLVKVLGERARANAGVTLGYGRG